jgi:hypothetical protein
MRNVLSLSCVLACAAYGCAGGASEDEYEQAAQEVESAVAALDQEDSDDTAIDGAADDADDAAGDDDADSDEATEEANGGHADEDHARDDRRHRRHHGRGNRHGRGHGLLLWYADLDALQMCRELRESCLASAEPATCKEEVRACVKPILDAAFAAMCEERVAMCSADDAPERKCARVAKHCGGDTPDAG